MAQYCDKCACLDEPANCACACHLVINVSPGSGTIESYATEVVIGLDNLNWVLRRVFPYWDVELDPGVKRLSFVIPDPPKPEPPPPLTPEQMAEFQDTRTGRKL